MLNGVCHLAGAEIPVTGWHLGVRPAVNRMLPLASLYYATVCTKRTAAAARAEHQAYAAAHPGTAHVTGALEAGEVRA